MSTKLPDQAELRSFLDYDAVSGALVWKPRTASDFPARGEYDCKRWNARYAGQPALSARHNSGYERGRILGLLVLKHRVIWKLVTGEEPLQIDHVDGDRSFNAFTNLRSVDNLENNKNKKINANNTTGALGVRRVKTGFKVTLTCKGKRFYLGTFPNIEAAIAARKAGEADHGFHKNHGRQ